jgi:hypothetical protein
MHLLHRWADIETIGRVVTQRCSCGKTRVQIRSKGGKR